MAKIKNKKKVFLITFWTLFALPILILTVIFILISNGKLGYMPSFEQLENPKSRLASEVISEDGVVLGSYYVENRTFIDFKDISPALIDALIATEDIRFYNHSAIDARGLARVFVKTLILGQSSAGGGSTITQQLAKNLFPRDTATYSTKLGRNISLIHSKLKEWVTAVKLEKSYTKNEIITLYLNQFDFLYHAVGIKSAAKVYFNTSPDSLALAESAMLVGMVKNPSYFNPIRRPEISINRRNVVLSQMQKYGFITEEVYDSVSQEPLVIDYQRVSHDEGLATYFREYLRLMLNANEPQRRNFFTYAQYQEDSLQWVMNPLYGWCKKNLKPDGNPYNLYTDGIKIYTTVNSRMQKYAEESINDHLSKQLQPAFFKEKSNRRRAPFSNDLTSKEIESILNSAKTRSPRYRSLRNTGISADSIDAIFNEPVPMTIFTWAGEKDTLLSPMDSIRYFKFFLRSGFMAMDPKTGYVKAYAGGPDYKYFKYDPVKLQKRQVGSTIKPFLYTLAMQEGLDPCMKVPNVPTTFEVNDTTWTPKNSGSSDYEGKMVSLKWGLANSVNWISAWVMKRFNPYAVIDVMKKMGVTSYLDPVPSLVLGTSDISLYEMVGAYSTYANQGVYTEPIFVTKIEDKNGNVISIFQPHRVDAISESTAYLMLKLMMAVANEGTAIRLRLTYELDNDIAAKTGTTQNHSDGWFIGVTPNLSGGVWTGAEDRSVHFDGITMGQGANMALPIWATFMQKVYADEKLNIEKESFEFPEEFEGVAACDQVEQSNIENPQNNRFYDNLEIR